MKYAFLALILGVFGAAAASAQTPPVPSPTATETGTVTQVPGATPTSTQVPANAVEVFIPDSVLQAEAAPASGATTMAQVTGSLTLLADGQECATISLTDNSNRTAGGKVIAVPLNTPVAACRTPGSTLTFVTARGNTLNETFRLELGARFQLANLIPAPVSTGNTGPISPPSTGSAGLASSQ
jgi:hypothetical protein